MSTTAAQPNTLRGEPDFFSSGRTAAQIKEEVIGPLGTPARTQYDLDFASKIISLQIRAYRQQQQLTQVELAKRVGVTHNQIFRMERRPLQVPVEMLVRICKALDIRVTISVAENDTSSAAARKLFLVG